VPNLFAGVTHARKFLRQKGFGFGCFFNTGNDGCHFGKTDLSTLHLAANLAIEAGVLWMDEDARLHPIDGLLSIC
jgi:hypothetical protein